jgi:LPS O-antigen subunit length determinant protein (WzzB/FepE family)
MKKNNSYLEDQIDLREIIKTLWHEKILILSISLIFMIVGYVYGALQPKIYKTEIVLREAPSSLFLVYQPFFSSQQQQQQQQPPPQDIARQLNDNFKLNLSSLDTLVQFVEETNTINDFKNHLKEKNISARNYFKDKFKPVIDKKIQNKYSLTYLQPLAAEAFLNNYIIFTWQQSLNILKKQLTQIIINEINNHQQQLEIAKKINLENPILQSKGEGQNIINEPQSLFYNGSKALTLKINYLNELLNKTKNLTLDYNPILEQASSGLLISKSTKFYAVAALFLGLFFSLMIVFIRSLKYR